MPEPRTPVALQIALVTAVICMFTGMAVLIYLSYSAGLPEQPDPATGHIIQLNVHGTVLYMTELQRWLSNRLVIGGLVLGACSKVIQHFWRS